MPLAIIFAPGFFSSAQVASAALIGGLVACVAAPVGFFGVTRRQAFAAEALGDIGVTGGSAAVLLGAAPLSGFVAADALAAATMELLGLQRVRSRDLATGVVLGAGLGLASLLLYLDTSAHSTTGAATTILFGSLFTAPASTIPAVAGLGALAVALISLVNRPLLLSVLLPEVAAARGIRLRLVGAAYLGALALCVALCALAVGAILATALLIGPPAAAIRMTRRPAGAIATAAAIGVGAVLLGILLTYDSYYWPPHHGVWPVSFFVVMLVLAAYLASGVVRWRRGGS